MKVLITSISSYVGYYIAERLSEDMRNTVYGTYRRESERTKTLNCKTNVLLYSIDLLKSNLESFIDDNIEFDLIINSTGAYETDGVSKKDVLYANINAAVLINNIANKNAAKNMLIVNFSSLSVYGSFNKKLIDESTLPSPANLYGTTKLLSEQILELNDKYKIVHLRFPVVLGNGAHRAWLPSMLDKMRRNEEIEIYNPNSVYTTCTTLYAVYDFLVKLYANRNSIKKQVFCIGAKSDLTIHDICIIIAEHVGYIKPIKVKENSEECCQLDSNKAIEFGYKPPSMSDALKYWLNL